MPQAIPILIAGIAAAAGPALAGMSTAVIIGSFVIGAALSGAGMLLQKPSQQSSAPPSPFVATDPGSKVTVRTAANPRLIVYGRTRVNGTILFVCTSSGNSVLHLVVALADHRCEAIDEIYFGDELAVYANGVIDLKYNGKVGVTKYLGTEDQVADPNLMANAPGVWTATERLQGVTYIYISLAWDREVFKGLPDIWAVVRGKNDIYDPRTGQRGYTTNAALCTADYVASVRHGLGAAYDTAQNMPALIAAANACDEAVPLKDGGTEKRYTCNGAISTSQKPIDIMGGLLSSMAGKAVYSAGKWKLLPGVWIPPVSTIDEDDLRAGFTVQNLLGRREAFNAVKGTFANPAKLWQADDFPSVGPGGLLANYAGQPIYKDAELAFTDSASAAQRIVRIDLRRAQQPLTFVLPCKLSTWPKAVVGENIALNIKRLGFVNKAFEVVSASLVFDHADGQDGPVIVGVDIKLRETGAYIFDWSSTEEQALDPIPNTTLPDVFNVLPASNLRQSWDLYETRGAGGAKVRWTLRWDASPDRFVVSGGWYRPEYRRVGDALWTQVPETKTLFADIFDLDPGTYEARVFAVNWIGAPSPPVALPPVYISGLAEPPLAPLDLTVEANMGFGIARWMAPTELDVLRGGYISFRHSALMSGAAWGDGISISDPLPAVTGMAILPLKAGTYLAKFIDSSGNPSSGFAAFSQSQASLLTFTTVGSVVESPTFTGGKTYCSVSGGALYLDWSPGVGVRPAGSYTFASRLDLGSVQKVRLTSLIQSEVLNVFDDFDSRDGDVDSWPSWDGESGSDEADARLWVRATDGDPNASPTWGPWQRLDVADFEKRGFEFRLDLESRDSSFSIYISTLSVAAQRL